MEISFCGMSLCIDEVGVAEEVLLDSDVGLLDVERVFEVKVIDGDAVVVSEVTTADVLDEVIDDVLVGSEVVEDSEDESSAVDVGAGNVVEVLVVLSIEEDDEEV